ncbi:MAG: zinc-dependent alcohol dehydrogenase family protein [Pseudomonadota bacterium]
MKAQVITAHGGPEVFETAELPDPVPGSGQVLIRQEATSVNPVDYKIRQLGLGLAPALPAVLGADIAGTVVAVGDGVAELVAGDKVWGAAGGVAGQPGAYAELIAARADLVAKRPDTITAREAAAFPLVTITAWEGLQRAGIAPGQKVLIRGGTGGVGHVAVQLAKIWGAEVTATISSDEKAQIVRRLGADHIVNYRAETIEDAVARITGGTGFDIVFDTTGIDELDTAFAAARPNGHVATTVSLFSADLTAAHVKGLSVHVVFMLIPMLHGLSGAPHQEILNGARALIDDGKLTPLIDSERFALSDIAAAHERAESGGATGKVVVDIPG